MERIDRTNLTVKANNGQSMNVKLADNFVVVGIAKASLADVASGTAEAMNGICDQHSRAIPSESYTQLETSAERLAEVGERYSGLNVVVR